MRTRALSCLFLTLLTVSPDLSAQGFALGGRAGTLGFGAEAALELSDQIVLRGGVGSFFLEFDGDFDEVEYTVSPPSLTGTLGVDLYPFGGSFRLMAGMMFRDGDIDIQSSDLADVGPIEIGNNEYDEAGTLHGVLATKSAAPFVGLGFGRHTQGGFGFFLDLGVAFVGDADVSLEAQGPLAAAPGLQQDLDLEVQDLKDDVADYLKYWPILSIGVKIPLG